MQRHKIRIHKRNIYHEDRRLLNLIRWIIKYCSIIKTKSICCYGEGNSSWKKDYPYLGYIGKLEINLERLYILITNILIGWLEKEIANWEK